MVGGDSVERGGAERVAHPGEAQGGEQKRSGGPGYVPLGLVGKCRVAVHIGQINC